MKNFRCSVFTIFTVLLCLNSTGLFAQFTQQGNKLVGTGAVGGAWQGLSVAISDDGTTAIVGGFQDNSAVGAVWIYTRTGNTWTQQGSKLVGTGATGAAFQGISAALSGDGNTALVGGFQDNINQGAVWVFTRSGGTWTQQGSKLVGTGATGGAQQGISVALSSDGNTAIVGGDYDNVTTGAVWVYTRSGSTWTQQGSKLVGTGASGAAHQGNSLALSSDGNTAFVGGFYDANTDGAAWAFTRTGSTWAQQGNKLVGTGASGARAFQARSVALSGDGRTAFMGGHGDAGNTGAVWVFYNGRGVSVNTIGNGTSTIKIFPSPTEGVITIDNDGLTIDNITVYNNLGQLVLTTKVVNQLDLSALPSGMYFVQVKVGSEVATEKVFKQ